MTTSNIVPFRNRMSEAEYDAERAKLEATYGKNKKEAGAKRDQALAILFDRSNWTQEELAEKENEDRRYIGRRLLFGRFLNFGPFGPNNEFAPASLSEGRFRKFWERTNKDHKEPLDDSFSYSSLRFFSWRGKGRSRNSPWRIKKRTAGASPSNPLRFAQRRISS